MVTVFLLGKWSLLPCRLWKLATACKFGTPKASVINYPQWNIPSTSAKRKAWQAARFDTTLFSQGCKVDFPPFHSPPKPQNKRISFEKHLRWWGGGWNCTWDCLPETELVLSKIVKKWGDCKHPFPLCPTASLLLILLFSYLSMTMALSLAKQELSMSFIMFTSCSYT